MRFDNSYFEKYGIEFSAVIPFDKCGIINERRLGVLKKRLQPASVIVFLVPYYAGEEKRNISKYAVSKDYHLFMRQLFDSVCPELSEKYGAQFCGMADSAPVNEVKAAAYAGLGMLGDNGMLINEKYGSYIFIGALYTDAVFEYEDDKTSYCVHCGACSDACGMGADPAQDPDSPECIRCGACIHACPPGALRYGTGGFGASLKAENKK